MIDFKGKNKDKRSSELVMQQDIIENKITYLERFAYIASHDLKAPVRIIGSFVQLIEREVKPYNNHKLDEYLQFAKDGTKQINVLIEDILELSKLD
jgi:light-regulated signal transduction histidine kinase (bacteriophytochrome)